MVILPITFLTAIISLLSPQKFVGSFTVQEAKFQSDTVPLTAQGANFSPVDLETRMNNLEQLFRGNTLLFNVWTKMKNDQTWGPARRLGDNEGVEDLANRMNVEPIKGTDFIRIEITSDSETDARNIAETFYREFMDQYRQISSQAITSQNAFIDDEVKKAQRTFDVASGKLLEYQKQTGAAFGIQQQQAVQQLAGLEVLLKDAERGRVEALRRVAQTSQRLRSDPNYNAAFVKGYVNTQLDPNYSQFVSTKANLENELVRQGQIKGRNHPDILALHKQISDVDARIKGILRARAKLQVSSESNNRNQLRDQMISTHTQAQLDLATADQRIATATQQLNEKRAQIKQMPIQDEILAKLELDKNIAQADLQHLKMKKNEAAVKLGEQLNSTTLKTIQGAFARYASKKTAIKTVLAFALSAVLAISLVLLLNQFDTGAYNAAQAEKALGYNVIAALPKFKQARLPKDEEMVTALGASYQMLSTNLMGANGRMQGPAIVVGSAHSNVGRTTVAANLAVTLARDGARVLLVDADLRQPTLHRQFRVENRQGLSEILQEKARADEVVLPTTVEGLLFIPAGQPPVNPVRLLRSPAMARFIEQVSKGTDYIVIDTPAGATFADVGILAQVAKNVVLVHEAGAPATDAEAELNERLERMGANIIGIVLNKVRFEDAPGTVDYHRSYEATMALRGASGRHGVLTGAERSLTAGRPQTDEDDDEV